MNEKNLKFEGYKSQKERYEAIIDETAREVEKITFSRVSEGEADELKKSKEKFRERSMELWKEFAVHGIFRFDREEKKVKLLPFTDLDGKTCLGLFKLAGFDTSNVIYVPPGEFVPGAINLDTGGKTGIKVEDRTAWMDHHGKESTEVSICAARWVYLALLSKNFLEKDPVLDKLTQFVSRIDREKFPQAEKYFDKGNKTVLGLHRFFSFENLYDYFKEGSPPTEVLSDKDIERYDLVERSKEQRKIIENSKKILEELARDGFVINTKFGKIAIDVGKRVPGGYEAARAAGFDGYVIYNPMTESFFISIDKADLSSISFEQGKNIRGNMWIKSQGEEKPLKVSLKEIIEKLGGEIPEKGELKDMCGAIEKKFKEFIITPELTPDKKGNLKYATWELGKLAIFPKGFKPEAGKKYKVKIKVDTAPSERKGFYILEVIGER